MPRDQDKMSGQKPHMSQGWQLAVTALAAIGFIVAMVIRHQWGLSGAVNGAIFGGLGASIGTGLGYLAKSILSPDSPA